MDALYYPFHLCHEQTLHQILKDFSLVHFLDFMALQFTPFMGATGFPDRMGDYHPELLESGRIIQGHDVSGPLSPTMVAAVNQDLADPLWRSIVHGALKDDRRFHVVRSAQGIAMRRVWSPAWNTAVLPSTACRRHGPTASPGSST